MFLGYGFLQPEILQSGFFGKEFQKSNLCRRHKHCYVFHILDFSKTVQNIIKL